jgi:hypothetical protein
MNGIAGEVPQCKIESAEEPYEIVAEDPIYEAIKLKEYKENLWFEPVPMEMLYTMADRPQVRVTVNGLPAVCPENNCGYKYVEAGNANIDDTVLSGKQITIKGSDFDEEHDCEAEAKDMKVEFADQDCEIDSTDLASGDIVCTLKNDPAAGTHQAKVSGKCGNFNYQNGPEIEVSLEISDVSPSSDLNKLGGDLITITGSGFPTEKEPVVTFDDGTVCKYQSGSSTTINCISARFDQFNLKTNYDLKVQVNDKEETFEVTLGEHIVYATQLNTPTSMSPVLEGEITIQLSEEYPNDPALHVNHFAAELNLVSEITQGHWQFDFDLGDFVWIPDETTAWPLYVKSVDSAARTVTLKFKGAPTGDYIVLVSSANQGRLDDENLTLRTEAYVTGISPTGGSALGGTVVTISGENFSNNYLDNAVMIGDALCLVQSSSP